jgi:8-oxo-dGTP pyrophosphatase MutT (NUDIX family)
LIETEKDEQRALVLTPEYRHELSSWDYRLPGGKVFDTLEQYNAHRSSDNEILSAAVDGAKREGREEAGIIGGVYEHILTSVAGGSAEWDLYYIQVLGAEFSEQDLEESERGDIEKPIAFSARELFEKLCKGEIREGRSADVIWRWLAQNGYTSFTDPK